MLAAENEAEATQILIELKDALREHIREIKDRASEVVPLMAGKQKSRRAA